jgi:hypothetical protein
MILLDPLVLLLLLLLLARIAVNIVSRTKLLYHPALASCNSHSIGRQRLYTKIAGLCAPVRKEENSYSFRRSLEWRTTIPLITPVSFYFSFPLFFFLDHCNFFFTAQVTERKEREKGKSQRVFFFYLKNLKG